MLHYSRRQTLFLAAALTGAFSSGILPVARAAQANDLKRAAIIYFSMPETDKAEGMTQDEANSTHVVNGRVYGNVEWLATLIERETKADVIRLLPEAPYPKDHKTLVAQAEKEKEQNFRPALSAETKKALERLSQYDVIYLGHPIWWYTYPPILLSFLESYDLSGKTVVPFVAHGGSGFADTLERLAKLQPKAKILKGYRISRRNMEDAQGEVPEWLAGLKL